MLMSLHELQKNYKINDKILSTRHDNLPKHIPIQKWAIKQPQHIRNHPRVPESRLQQVNITFGVYEASYH